MFQEALIGIVFGKLVFKNYKALTITIIADSLFVIKFVTPVPYLKDSLFFQEKPRAITIIARIFSYSNFRLIIYHKPAPLHLFMYVIML